MKTEITEEAEKLFLKKYGNKISATESWVIRFAVDFANHFSSLSEEKKEPDGWVTDNGNGWYINKKDGTIPDYYGKLIPFYFCPLPIKEVTDEETQKFVNSWLSHVKRPNYPQSSIDKMNAELRSLLSPQGNK